MRNRHRGGNRGLLLLASQVFQMGINIPPVTLATLGLNVYLFLFPLVTHAGDSVENCWGGDLRPLHHAHDWHLYYNMASLLWKGSRLERRLGGPWFAYLLSVFSLLTGVVYLLLEKGLAKLTGNNMQCTVGFSGVLFGLKVVNSHQFPGGVTHVMGFPVANSYACWAELILIHVMSPGTSFVGHLAGILVGLLYTKGPLMSVMKVCAGLLTGNGDSARRRHYYNSSGGATHESPGNRFHIPPPQPDHLEEIRLRRLQRFEGHEGLTLQTLGGTSFM